MHQLADSKRLQEISARLDAWDERLQTPANTHSDPAQQPIERALQNAVEAGNRTLLEAIEQGQDRLQTKIEQSTQSLLEEVARLGETVAHLSSVQQLIPCWVPPAASVPDEQLLLGRSNDLIELEHQLAPGLVVAIQGMPGIGKTSLA